MLEMGVKEEHMGGREGGMSAYVQQKNAIGSARHAHPAGEWVIPRGERGKTMGRLNGVLTGHLYIFSRPSRLRELEGRSGVWATGRERDKGSVRGCCFAVRWGPTLERAMEDTRGESSTFSSASSDE